jgi:hypothetical protein
MNSKERAALSKKIVLPLLPGFQVQGPLTFAAPITHTLRAIHIDSHSSEWARFYVHAFILPLYVPREHIGFNFGRRLGNQFWEVTDPQTEEELKTAIQKDALPILAELETPLDAAAAVARWAQWPDDIHAEEAIAYSLVLTGETDSVIPELDHLIEYAQSLTYQAQWNIALRERAQLIKTKLLADPNEAKAQLAEWRKESLRNLKLEKYAEEVYTP